MARENGCRHNYAPRTQQAYVAQIARLARHFGVSPDQLTREQVQQYQDLLVSQEVSWLPQATAAMQFFYNKTLERDWKITHSSHCLAAGMEVAVIQQILGRASLETTATYTHVTAGTTGADGAFPDLLDEAL
jgi:transposase-like protein